MRLLSIIPRYPTAVLHDILEIHPEDKKEYKHSLGAVKRVKDNDTICTDIRA